eukprot:1132405-Lingulodinium_polyedra.AAC.1
METKPATRQPRKPRTPNARRSHSNLHTLGVMHMRLAKWQNQQNSCIGIKKEKSTTYGSGARHTLQ